MLTPKPVADHHVIGDDAKTKRNAFACDITVVDGETTGFAAGYHDLIELAAIRIRQGDGQVVAEWSRQIIPEHPERADPQALVVNGYTPERWREAVSLRQAMEEFFALSHDTAILAHKVTFDSPFLTAALKRCGLIAEDAGSPWYYEYCTLSDAHLMLRGLVPRLRSEIVSELLGLEPEPKTHEALNGARQCLAIYRRLRQIVDDPEIARLIAAKVHSFTTT